MTYALALLAGIVGGALGFALGTAAAALLAPVLGISGFEGAAGYFALFVGGPLGAILGLVLGATLVLRRAGHRSLGAIGGRVALVFVGAVGVGGAVLAGFWFMRPILNADGPAPRLVFEIRLPQGAAATGGAGYTIELQTSKNRMPGTLEAPVETEGRAVIAGTVEMYFRTWQRMLVLTTPDRTDVLFDLKLWPSPAHAKAFGAWQRADYIGEPGKDAARRSTETDRYEVRYRTAWVGED